MSHDKRMTIKTGGRILVLDDDVDLRYKSSDIFADSGCRVDVAHNGCAVREMLQRTWYDVALLNLEACGIDGLPLYREIKRLQTGTVTVMVTACAHSPTAEEAVAAGAWQIVPDDFAQLSQLLDRALEYPLVLVVDDDTDLCAKLWHVLTERVNRAFVAHHELYAVQRLKRREYKAVLIDAKLSHKSGNAEICLQVQEANPDTRVMLVTGRRTRMSQIVQRLITESADAVCYMRSDLPKHLDTVEWLPRNERGSCY
jgi:DNA-binding NtrC family response regulator